jgi:hypothetical protein
MESRTRVLPPEMLVEDLLAALNEAQAVPLVITGSSMSPFLVHGRDTVFLSKINHAPRKGDMIFYRRANGSYILHRVFRTGKDACDMVGDAQTAIEKGVPRERMLAVVTAVRRKGKLLKKGSFWWDFFEKVWIRLVPVRPLLQRCYGIFRK